MKCRGKDWGKWRFFPAMKNLRSFSAGTYNHITVKKSFARMAFSNRNVNGFGLWSRAMLICNWPSFFAFYPERLKWSDYALYQVSHSLKIPLNGLSKIVCIWYRVSEQVWNRLILLKALDFDVQVISSFRSPFSTLCFSLKIKSFTKQNMFYRSDILHDFSISTF